MPQEFPRWKKVTFRPGGEAPAGAAAPNGRGPVVTATVRVSNAWPRTATTTLTLHGASGDTVSNTGHDDFTPARRIRTWTRFLHTGQALGWPGQLVAGLACLGGCFLVYTGFALSFRRFFRQRAVVIPQPGRQE